MNGWTWKQIVAGVLLIVAVEFYLVGFVVMPEKPWINTITKGR